MITIWKFPLQVTDAQVVEMPLPAKILAVQPQGESVCLWAEVDPEAEKVKVDIIIAGTGHRLPAVGPASHLQHISTFHLHGGALVFHAFEVVNRA